MGKAKGKAEAPSARRLLFRDSKGQHWYEVPNSPYPAPGPAPADGLTTSSRRKNPRRKRPALQHSSAARSTRLEDRKTSPENRGLAKEPLRLAQPKKLAPVEPRGNKNPVRMTHGAEGQVQKRPRSLRQPPGSLWAKVTRAIPGLRLPTMLLAPGELAKDQSPPRTPEERERLFNASRRIERRRLADQLVEDGVLTEEEAEFFAETGALAATAKRRGARRLEGLMEDTFSEFPPLKRLWALATQGLHDLGDARHRRRVFGKARRRFWRMVRERNSDDAKAVYDWLATAGFVFRRGSRNTTAPVLLLDGTRPLQGWVGTLTIDHVVPLTDGGAPLRAENLQLLLMQDNTLKRNKFPLRNSSRD